MTNIYIYCVFDNTEPGRDVFKGVYSSIKSAHRDALRLANRSTVSVRMYHHTTEIDSSLVSLRNTFKGKCDVEVKYRTPTTSVSIYKTRIKE